MFEALLFTTRTVAGMLWSLPVWGALREIHQCACELLGCWNGEELTRGSAGAFKKLFFTNCRWFYRVKLGFYPSVSTWACISKILEAAVALWELEGMKGDTLFWWLFRFSSRMMLSLAVYFFCSAVALQHKIRWSVAFTCCTDITGICWKVILLLRDKGSGRVCLSSCSWWNILSSASLWSSLLHWQIRIFQSFFSVSDYLPCRGFRGGAEHVVNPSFVWLLIMLVCKEHKQ